MSAATLGLFVAGLIGCAAELSSGDSLLDSLREDLRPAGQAIVDEPSPEKRAARVREFAREHGSEAEPLLLELLETDPSPRVRARAVRSLHATSPEAIAALSRRASSDPDVGVALRALEELHEISSRELVELLEERMRMPATAAEQERLADAHDHWVTVARGGMLPAFLRQPPEPFDAVPGAERVRVVAFGDFGKGDESQEETAAALRAYHDAEPLDFGITLGDNFYPKGMQSPGDPRWRELWIDPYAGLGIRFYPSLGNHDWGFADSPAAQVLYSDGGSWYMPAARYAFHAGPADFFALDTSTLSAAQLDWLERSLVASDAPWKVVYGHHPIRSSGRYRDDTRMAERLLPVLQAGGADLYLAGHEHHMEHVRAEGGVSFVIAGSGGAGLRRVSPGPNSLFARSAHGFAVLDVERDSLTVTLVDTDLAHLHEFTLRADQPLPD
jgi:hypothetical protein